MPPGWLWDVTVAVTGIVTGAAGGIVSLVSAVVPEAMKLKANWVMDGVMDWADAMLQSSKPAKQDRPSGRIRFIRNNSFLRRSGGRVEKE
jgi:hypothetical protein